ncbi:MAG: murein L,D-transpeptidase catalytic domain family protein [Bacteroidetes bacterium]|nr:murein L,D-transpeptidase catalytic domain family protein [Bacteroidota bacterium]
MQLNDVVNYKAFAQAIAGYNKMGKRNNHIVTLIDFTKPSTDERLYVFDIKRKKMLYSSHVAHGRNSGENYATSFSNKMGSYQSSLGFFLTENTYYGKHGYSLILHGLEKGINDQAKDRAIVIHGAAYANPSVIEGSGRLGRSLGCPALPQSISDTIISAIKDGSLLYIYANDKDYFKQSSFLAR